MTVFYLFVLVAIFPYTDSVTSEISITTPDDYKYVTLTSFGIPKYGSRILGFKVKAKSDAHILLTSTDGRNFEIVIGGWGNSMACIREAPEDACVEEYEGKLLNKSQLRWFWIQWPGNRIIVGKGRINSTWVKTLMEYRSYLPINIKSVGISTGFGATGTWKFPIEIDACASHSCGEHGTCRSVSGRAECVCNDGFRENYQGKCDEDIDECLIFTCGPNSHCENTVGSFECHCMEGFNVNENGDCEDTDECSYELTCGPNSQCENTVGSFLCRCIEGYSLDENGECKENIDCSSLQCGPNSYCNDTYGDVTCTCHEGYQENENGTCEANLCTFGLCAQNAPTSRVQKPTDITGGLVGFFVALVVIIVIIAAVWKVKKMEKGDDTTKIVKSGNAIYNIKFDNKRYVDLNGRVMSEENIYDDPELSLPKGNKWRDSETEYAIVESELLQNGTHQYIPMNAKTSSKNLANQYVSMNNGIANAFYEEPVCKEDEKNAPPKKSVSNTSYEEPIEKRGKRGNTSIQNGFTNEHYIEPIENREGRNNASSDNGICDTSYVEPTLKGRSGTEISKQNAAYDDTNIYDDVDDLGIGKSNVYCPLYTDLSG